MTTTNASIVSLDGSKVAVWADGGSIWLTRPNRSNPITLIEVGQYGDDDADPSKHYVVGGGELVFEVEL